MYQGPQTAKLLTQYLFNKSWLIAISMLAITIIVSSTLIALPHPYAAYAAYAAHGATPTLTVTPSSQAYYSQTKLKVQGSNFPHTTSVTIYWNYSDANNPGTPETTFTTNTKGNFIASFNLPLAPTGNYTIASVYIVNSQTFAVTTTFQLLPNLDVTPRATGVGSRFTITGQAFGAGEIVDIYWNCSGSCTGSPLTSIQCDNTGSFSTSNVNIPADTTYGKIYITGTGESSHMSGTGKVIVYQPTLALAPLSGSAGTPLTVSAYGFQSNENIKVFWNNGTTPIMTGTANTNGYFLAATPYTVPVGSAPGSYSVQIKGNSSHLLITNTFTVVAPSSSLSIASGPIGARVRVSGQGYTPGETVNVYWNYGSSGSKNVATIQVGSTGTFHVSFLVPTKTNGIYTTNATYPVAAIGANSNSTTINTFTVAPGLVANPANFSPGASTNLAGSGFQGSEVVNLYWDNTAGKLLYSGNTDANGDVNPPVSIPTTATPGSHTIVGVGQSSGTTFNAPVTVDTGWTDFGFGTAHLRQNPFENSVNATNVSGLQKRWSASIGTAQPVGNPAGAPSPVYYNGTAYIATFDGHLNAYDPGTGNTKWQFNTNTGFANLTTPVIDSTTNTIFFGTLGFLEQQDHGVPSPFFAVDTNGNLLWSIILPGDDYAFPTLAFNTIYIGMANEGAGSLLAIDETSGSVIGQYKAGGGVWGAVGVDSKTNTIFTGVGNPGDQVLAFDATAFKGTSPQPIWTFTAAKPGIDDDIGTAMAVNNGLVYVDSKNGTMYALHESDGTVDWTAKIGASSIGNVSSPAVDATNGVVYVGSLNGNLYALDAASGALHWKAPTTVPTGDIYSSPALANGVVYVASNDGNFYAFNATNGSRLWNYNTGQLTFSSPILVNGWLYCASTDGYLYAFSL